MKTIKCVWCGSVVPLTGDGKRPKQHKDGPRICLGSGQLVETHQMLHESTPDKLKPKPKKK